MKLNFKEFSIPSGISISKRNWQTTDVREQVADLLYTHANGIKAHRLAFKILDSNGDEEYSAEETGMVQYVIEQFCLPCVIDGLNILLQEENNKNE